MQDDGQADRPAADDDGDLSLLDLAALNGVPADGHRLGQRGLVGWQPVRDGQRERLLDEQLFGIGAGGRGREPDGVDVLATPDQRDGDDGRAGAQRLAGAGPVVEDFAAELVAEHHRLGRAHEVGVAGLGHHVGELVAVVAGV